MKKLIFCGQLFTAETDTAQNSMAIVLEDNRIVDIVSADQIKVTDNFDEVIDLSDKFVLPGLFDCHAHCAFNGTFSELSDEYMCSSSGPFIALKAIKNLQDDLMAGFTSIRDVGCCPDWADIAIRDAINQGYHWGPRMSVVGLTINATGGHGDNHLLPSYSSLGTDRVRAIICGADSARQAARINFKYGADGIKFMSTYGVMTPGDDPGPQELTYDEMRAIIEVAEFRGAYTCTHAHGLNGIKCAVRAGVTSIEHGTFIDEEAAEMMVERGTFLVPTLVVDPRMFKNMKPGEIKPNVIEKAKRCTEVHAKNIGMAYRKGVKIAFGTDVCAPYLYHGTQAEEFVYMVNEAGMKPAHALQSATSIAAQLLGWGDKLGTLSKGKLADIIAVDSDPLKDISTMQSVSFVMKDGEVYKNTRPKTKEAK